MSEKEINPSKVTKPIQLLAAWLVGLIVINGSFLGAASQIHEPTWIPALLAIAAVINVPIFICSLFVLQTKFRPEMQEDTYYATYLERQYSAETKKKEIIKSSLDKEHRIYKNISNKSTIFNIDNPSTCIVNPKKLTLNINDLLNDFKEIVGELRSINLTPDNTFGSTSMEATPPHPFIVSVGNFVDIEIIKKVIKIASKFGLEGVAHINDEKSDYNIYIGAYSYDDPSNKYLPLSNNDVLQKIIADNFTLKQFLEFVPNKQDNDT